MRYAPEKAQPYIFNQILQLFKAAVILMLLQMAARFIFIGLFTELVLLKKNLGLTFSALVLGWRYDAIPVAYLIAPSFLVTCSGFLFPREIWLRAITWFNRIWLSIGFIILLFFVVADLGFYSHFQEHINVLFFGLWEDDTQALLISINKNYRLWLWLPLMLFSTLAAVGLFFHFFRKERIDLYYAKPLPREELGMVFAAGVVVIAFFARGNFTRLPLSIEDAHISEIEDINELSVNGVIAFNRALRIRREFGNESVQYLAAQGYSSTDAAVSDLLALRGEVPKAAGLLGLKKTTPVNPAAEALKPHVVVFVMESFGSYWWPYKDKLPFLDAFGPHTTEDTLFLNFFSSENGTIGSVVSLATNIPVRPGARFLSEGEYMRTPLLSSAHLPYKRAGYTTRFVYGGKLGWRQLGSYLQEQGWDVLEGADQIKEKRPLYGKVKPADLGNEWGLFDEHVFNHVKAELAEATTPQVFFVLSTTFHPPFETPSHFKHNNLARLDPELRKLFNKPESEVLLRLKTLQYTNRTLGNFLTDVKTGPLKEKTVVAVTGDHSFWIGKDEGRPGLARKFGVPFYLYLPKALRPEAVDTTKWGSHIDIWPTLYHRTLSNADYWAFGADMFTMPNAALNSGGIVAGAAGAVVNGSMMCWGEAKMLVACESDPAKEILRNYQRALIGLTDEFLRAHKDGGMTLIDRPADVSSGPPLPPSPLLLRRE